MNLRMTMKPVFYNHIVAYHNEAYELNHPCYESPENEFCHQGYESHVSPALEQYMNRSEKVFKISVANYYCVKQLHFFTIIFNITSAVCINNLKKP